jgi:hypothetical protein
MGIEAILQKLATNPIPSEADSTPGQSPLPSGIPYESLSPGQFDETLLARGYPVQPQTGRGFAGMEAPPAAEETDGKGNRWARLGGKVVDALIGPGAKGMTKTEKAMTLMLSLGQGVRTGLGMQYGYQGPSFLEAARMYGDEYAQAALDQEERDYRRMQPLLTDQLIRDRMAYNEQLRAQRPDKTRPPSTKTTWAADETNPGWLTQLERDPDTGDWTPSLREGKPIRKRAPRAKGASGYTEQKRSSDAKTIRSRRQAVLEMEPAMRASWAMDNPGQVRSLTAYNPMIPDEETDAFREDLGTNLGGIEGMVPRDVRPVIEGEVPEEGPGLWDRLFGSGGKEEAPLPIPKSADQMKADQVYEKDGRYYVRDENGDVLEVQWQD